jgi:hypothetical protein
MHWINAIAIFIMIGSGWKIYNDEVIFGWLHFPEYLTIGKWAQHGLQWHFLGMWIFVLNGLAYLTYGLVSGRFRRMLLPVHWKDVIRTIHDALRFDLAHDDLTKYNAVQKLLYIRSCDLETGSVFRIARVVWQLSERTPRPLSLHVGDRPFHCHPCSSRITGASRPGVYGDRRSSHASTAGAGRIGACSACFARPRARSSDQTAVLNRIS